MERPKFDLRTLFVVLTASALWCGFANWHLGWAIFLLICLPAILVTISVIECARRRFAKVAILLPCLCLIYAYSLPPFDVALRWCTGKALLDETNGVIWNAYVLPIYNFQKMPWGDRILRMMLSDYYDVWNTRKDHAKPELQTANKGLQTKPSISRFDLRRVNCSGSLNPAVRQELNMHAMNPTGRYDLGTSNRLGMLALLVIANLSIAMSYFVRIPMGMEWRHVVVPALSTASILLFSLSLFFVAWFSIRSRTSQLVALLAIANGLLALAQQLVFLSSWMT